MAKEQEIQKVQEKVLEEVPLGVQKTRGYNLDNWNPKTELGKRIKNGELNNIDEVLNSGKRILETEIVDYLLPDL